MSDPKLIEVAIREAVVEAMRMRNRFGYVDIDRVVNDALDNYALAVKWAEKKEKQ